MISRKHLFAALVVPMIAVSGCASGPAPGNGDRLAPSLEALIAQALESDDLSDWDRAALEKASQEGSISQADYVEGVDLFDACLKSNGVEFARMTLLNGVIESQPPAGTLTAGEVSAQAKAQAECYTSTNAVTQEFFRMQQANPDLLSDIPQAAVNCLRDAGIVGEEFTKQDFDDLLGSQTVEPDDHPFDLMDPAVQTCLYSLGYAVKFDE